jgi:hypothetical protein
MDKWRPSASRGGTIFQRHVLEKDVYDQLTLFTPREIFEVLLKTSACLKGKARWGEKTPNHVFYVENIKEWFPQAKIIQVVRHPCGVVASHLRRGRSRGNPASLWYYPALANILQWWLRTSRLACQYKNIYGEGFYVVKFEDLVTNAHRTVCHICRFIDEDFHQAMLSPPLYNSSFQNYESGYGFDEETLTRWQTRLPDWIKIVVLAACRSYTKAFGYR